MHPSVTFVKKEWPMCFGVFCHSSVYVHCCNADSYFGILATTFAVEPLF
jgi:hypothetical protein